MAPTSESVTSRLTGPRAERRLPGDEGVWVLIFGDMALFAVFFATFLFYRGREPDLFAASQASLDVGLGMVNTLLLLASSLLVAIGVAAARDGRRGHAVAGFGGAWLCALMFGVNKVIEYSTKVASGMVPNTNEFFMYYYVLTGLHMVHVLIGMALLGYMIRACRRTETPRRFAFIESGACFWHMVDLLWIVLFPLVYLVGRQ